MDAGRSAERAGRQGNLVTAHAAQTGGVGQDTETGPRAHPSRSSGERRARTLRRCKGDGSLLPTPSADASGRHVSPKVRSPVT